MKQFFKALDERLDKERLSYHITTDVGRGILVVKQMLMDYLKENNTVNQEVAELMCDRYCKFPEAYDENDNERMIEERCSKCPLNRLVE